MHRITPETKPDQTKHIVQGLWWFTVLERVAFPRPLQTILSSAVMVKVRAWSDNIPVVASLLVPPPQCSYQPAGLTIVHRVYSHLCIYGGIARKMRIAALETKSGRG